MTKTVIIVDVESSGVDSRLCSLLSVGAVEFENPSNQFYMECFAFEGAHVEKEAMEVNGFTLEEIQGNKETPNTNNQNTTPSLISPLEKGERKEKSSGLPARPSGAGGADSATSFSKGGIRKVTDREVVCAFLEWMKTCKEWTLSGQNVSFDRDFLKETAHRYHIDWPLAQRTLDLHTIAYAAFMRAGKEIPRRNNHSALNLEAILEYVGVPLKRKKHNALEDAKLEAEAFSRFFSGKNLFSEYALFSVPQQLERQL